MLKFKKDNLEFSKRRGEAHVEVSPVEQSWDGQQRVAVQTQLLVLWGHSQGEKTILKMKTRYAQ